MFVGIDNTPRDYAWGSPTAIAELLGHPASGGPEAELWLGAHPGSPSVILDPALAGGAKNLAEWIAQAPETALGSRFADAGRLPFLMKILAAHSPLSLQAHPSPERAAEGFALENAAGIPVDAADRNYRDPFHKPEIIFALSDTFEALCGFRDPRQIRSILAELRALDATMDDPQPGALAGLENRLLGADALHDVVDWLLRDGRGGDSGEVSWLVERVVALAERAAFLIEGGAQVSFAAELAMVRSLAAAYPGDPGIVISLLTNLVSLKRGEVLYLPAGNIHAYLSGLGVEVMASSDNVLRGGLTPKHIDVDELLEVLDFHPLPVPYLAPVVQSDGVAVYRPDVPDFQLAHISVTADAAADEAGRVGVPLRQVTLTGPAIAICTSGRFLVAGAGSSLSLARGESIYITPDESTVTFAGSGEVFLATTA
ncbi:mannose-6-phosphate isomerase, class I [Cryobacterium arcticum]|uniref:mannose-6-phosphate isomerase n=1 Tax=Cryobacterium arcticum TaxID=670052 RepID=A0A1B1BGF7_9MICO|nr:mannose-6-phosphate isomerase, class I [Cryobacterium arcticum]ANP71614.1 mannose-6-phosphate isomerase [Cryobacterium arcticum]